MLVEVLGQRERRAPGADDQVGAEREHERRNGKPEERDHRGIAAQLADDHPEQDQKGDPEITAVLGQVADYELVAEMGDVARRRQLVGGRGL